MHTANRAINSQSCSLKAEGQQPLISITPPSSPKPMPRTHRRNVSDTSGYRMGGKGSAFHAYGGSTSGDSLTAVFDHKSKSATTSPINSPPRYVVVY
ncbi:hypothetical protein DPMN_023524 [Dreissena polymorpha]|uniref:Uncharacterized protein n=1 Tax=Dreissena polymorpha TaxID=45954 RepID=A0A9D4LMI5_DREPO|nr:hypothetical protein DPMN_023524 [Dreissena polymorpha]